MNRRQPDGATKREHLEAAAAHGNRSPELDGPPCPAALEYLWFWFGELSMARPAGQWGMASIGYSDIAAWARLTRRWPDPFEVSCILALDRAFLKSNAPKAAHGRSKD